MPSFSKYKAQVGTELAALRHDPDALMAHLQPYRETAPSHQRLLPARPKKARPLWKPLTPEPAPRTWFKTK